MRSVRLAALALAACFAPLFAAGQAMTSITATAYHAGSSTVTGTICFTPINAQGNPIPITVAGGGFYQAGQPFCGSLSAGALTATLSVPNPITDSAPGHGYKLVVYNSVSHQSSNPLNIYGIGATTWSLDTYIPAYTVSTTSAFTFTTGSGLPASSCVAPALDVRVNSGLAVLYVCSGGTFLAASSGGSAIAANPTGLQTIAQPLVAGVQTELDVNALNGWRYEPAYAGSTTAARTTSAIASLATISGTPVGPIIIPANETPYNQSTNPMLSTSAQGPTVWDFRSSAQSGWPTGGSMLYNGSDECAKNNYYYPMRQLLNVCDYFHLSNYPNDTTGIVTLSAQNIIDGTPPTGNIQAQDGFGAVIWALQGTNTSSTRTFTTGAELEGILQGTGGAHMDIYNLRSTTWNTYSVDAPDTTNISLGAEFEATAQSFSTPLDQAAPWHIGRWEGVRAETTGVLPSKMFLTGQAAFTSGSGNGIATAGYCMTTPTAGDCFNDLAMTNQPLLICPTAGVDCGGNGGTLYTVSYTGTGTTVSILPVFAGASGTYYWYFYGNQYSADLGQNTWLEANGGGLPSPPDVRGGGGVLVDTALTSCIGDDPETCMLWMRNSSLSSVKTDGTYPRMGLAVDNAGDLLFYEPCTVTLTGSIAPLTGTTATLTVSGTPTGCLTPSGTAGPLAIGQSVVPPGSAYGANSYGIISAFGTGNGGAGTYILSYPVSGASATVSSTTLNALGVANVAGLGGALASNFTITGGFNGPGTSSLGTVIVAGTASLLGSVNLGAGNANYHASLSFPGTANRTVTLPDADSNTVVAIAATTGYCVQYIDGAGVQHLVPCGVPSAITPTSATIGNGGSSFSYPLIINAGSSGGGMQMELNGTLAWSIYAGGDSSYNVNNPTYGNVYTLLPTGQPVYSRLHSATGTRYLCIGTDGSVTSSATACSGT